MIKRCNKKQGSKQGIILLTVVFILAMAVIFISACMVMTQATRNRMYWKAEQSQARLTVTSAAEAFYQALEVGDFQEKQLKKLAKAGASGIFMTAVDSSGNYLPGMSKNSDNCTLLSLKAKDADCSEIYAYLVTTIGTEQERVKITFKVKATPKVYGLFGNPVDYNGMATNLNFNDFGYTNGKSVDDNFLVIRNGGSMQDASSKIYSNIVFTGGNVNKFQVDMKGGADFIFLGNATAGIEASIGTTNGWFFVNTAGNTTGAFSKGFGAEQLGATEPVVFANRTLNYSLNNLDGKAYYTIDVSGTSAVWKATLAGSNTLTDPGSEALQAVYDDTAKYVSQDFVDSIGEFPTTSEAFAQITLGDDPLPTSAPSTFTTLTMDQFKNYANTDASGTKILGDNDGDGIVDTPNIKLTPGGTGAYIGNFNGDEGGGKSYVFYLDGDTDYVIYLTGSGTTYHFNQATFVVVGPNANHNQVFVLESGVKLEIGNQNGKGVGCGFLSVKRDDYSNSAADYGPYLFGNKVPAEMTTKSSGGTYSGYYDSVQKPTIYILGAGSNNVFFCKETILEAYMGLFNPDSSTQSKVKCYNPPTYVYGRLMFDGFTTDDGGDINMPYCPGPNNGGNKPDVELYKFGYDVVSVDYYYTD